MIIQVIDVTIKRDDKPLIISLSFTLDKGQVIHIKGKNGSGKSTLLSALLYLYPADGKIINHATETHFLSHKLGIKPTLSVSDNLQFMSNIYDGKEDQDIDVIINAFRLPRNKLAGELSKGQLQKLALSRFFLLNKHENRLWILDEPFANLDSDTCALVSNLLNHHISLNGSIIITSHQSLLLDNQLILLI